MALFPRRTFLTTSLAFTTTWLPPVMAFTAEDLQNIHKLPTGVQYRDDRIGNGDLVQRDGNKIVLQVKGILQDGSIFLDTTTATTTPILHQLGSSVDYNYLSGNASRNQRSKITLGLEDGIVGMHQGGIRRIFVPSPLGYGNAGVSRYDAYRMGLQRAIPRNEILRYEVELLRCLPISNDNSPTSEILACCSEVNYPCSTMQKE
jgi:FKBP-type peptidyl-prolyl cis-trans isomerase